jgi:hypothetical chaperone protein
MHCAIDFGTSNSAVALPTAGGVELVRLEADNQTIPTAIFYNFEDNTRLFGRAAIAAYVDGFEGRLMRSMKSVLGTSLIDETTQLKGAPATRYIDIIAGFLHHLRQQAQDQSGRTIERAVLGRPVFFVDDDPKRDAAAQAALEKAARLVGFTDIGFQFEPIAAAFDYESRIATEKLALVADIGGGTSDFSLIRLGPQRMQTLHRTDDVLGHFGVHIAGTDFDRRVELTAILSELGYGAIGPNGRPVPHNVYFDLATWHLINTVYAPKRVAELSGMRSFYGNITHHKRLMHVVKRHLGHALVARAEQAKIDVAAGGKTQIELTVIEAGLAAAFDEADLTAAVREEVDQIVRGAIHTVKLAGLQPGAVDALYFTGGSTGLRFLSQRLSTEFSQAEQVFGDRFASVATGLGLYAQRVFGYACDS